MEALDREDVPCAPVLTRENVHLDPQVQANGIIVEDEHPVAGLMRQARPAEQMDGTPSVIRRPAPLLGQDTTDVLTELGLSPEELDDLWASGALGSRE